MPKKKVTLKTISGEEPNSKIFILSQDLSGLDEYERAKATKRFIDSETKVLEMVIESHLRQVLKDYGVIPYDGSNDALNKAFAKLELMGKKIQVIDRYYEIEGERIVGESANKMTVIQEGNLISCAIEIIFN